MVVLLALAFVGQKTRPLCSVLVLVWSVGPREKLLIGKGENSV